MALRLRLIDAGGNQITGGSTDPGYEGCIECSQWSWSSSFNPENLRDITITKSYDSATVPLLLAANGGDVLSANLFDIDTSTNPAGVQHVSLDGVRIQEIDIAGGSAPPSEERVTLRYNVIRFFSPDQLNSVTLGVR